MGKLACSRQKLSLAAGRSGRLEHDRRTVMSGMKFLSGLGGRLCYPNSSRCLEVRADSMPLSHSCRSPGHLDMFRRLVHLFLEQPHPISTECSLTHRSLHAAHSPPSPAGALPLWIGRTCRNSLTRETWQVIPSHFFFCHRTDKLTFPWEKPRLSMLLKSAQSSDWQTLGVYMGTGSGSDKTEATDVGWHTEVTH